MATAGASLWSTTAATNSTADPAVNAAEGMAPSALNDSMRAMMASVAKWRDDRHGITTGGTTTAYTVTTNSTFATTAAMSGYVFTIIPNATNTSATTTLAVDGLTAYQLNQSTGVGAPAGSLIIGTPYQIKYVHATTEFIVFGLSTLATTDIIGGTSNASIATDDTLPTYDLSATANRRMLVSDFLKVVNALTADATPDSAADYLMTYDASASAAKKVLLANIPVVLPRGYIDGCILSNGTDTVNDINVAAGAGRDSTNAVNITVAAMAGKQLDANWAAGAAAGMRNSAVGIANGTYHVYAVAKADGTQDIYAHSSTTVATVITALQAESGGSAYLYARRIGSIVRTAGASGIVQFVQVGDEFRVITPVLDVDTSSLGTSSVTFTLVNPPTGVSLVCYLNAAVSSASGGATVYVRHPSDTDTAPSPTVTPLGSLKSITTSVGAFQLRVMTNTSAQIAARSDTASDTVFRAAVTSYEDTRGKDA